MIGIDNIEFSTNIAPTFDASDPASLTIDEDAGATDIDGLLSATDSDDDSLTWSVAAGPSHGSLSGFPNTQSGTTSSGVDPSGLTYEPDADYDGSDSFDVQVSDGSATDTITVTVDVQDAPEVASITRERPASPTNSFGVEYTVTFTESVSGVSKDDFTATQVSGDVEGTPYQVSGSGSSYTVIVDTISGDGDLRLDLEDDDSITNGNGVPLGGAGTSGSADGSYTSGESFTVDNTWPTFDSGSAPSFAENGGGTVLDVEADDDAGSDYDTNVTYALVGGADQSAFSIVEDTGELSFDSAPDFENPTDDDSGNDYEVQVEAEDDVGNTATDTITVTVTDVDEAPTATDDSSESTDENNALSVANGATTDLLELASDPDSGDTVSFDTIDGTGFSDGNTVTLDSGATVIVNSDGSWTYDPNDQFDSLASGGNTTDSFTYTVSDDDGDADQGTITVTVTGVNDAPTASNDSSQRTDEDSVVSVTDGGGADLLELASDPDSGDSLSVDAVAGSGFSAGSAVTLDSGATVTVDSDGSWSYDPNGQFESLASGDSTDDSFTYTVTDGNGGTDQGTVTLTVDGVNDAPTLDVNAGVTVDEGSNANPISSSDLAASDKDGDSLTYDVTAAVSHGTLFVDGSAGGTDDGTLDGEAAIGTGTFTQSDVDDNDLLYSHDGSATTSDGFDFDVNDGNGGSVTGNTFSISVTAAPTVTAIERASPASPTNADSVDFTVSFSEYVSNVGTGDFRVTGVTGDVAGSVTNVSSSNGSSVTVTVGSITGDGDLRLDLEDDDSVTNGNGVPLGGVGTTGESDGSFTSGQAFSVDNTVPTFDSDTAPSFAENGVGTVLDIEADDDTGTDHDTNVTYTLVGGTDRSDFSIDENNGTLSFDSAPNFENPTDADGNNDYVVQVEAEDDVGNTATQTITVSITDVDEAPSAPDDSSQGTDEDTPLSVADGAAADLLELASDPDSGDTLSIDSLNATSITYGSPVTLDSGATVTVQSNGSWRYDPNGQFDSLASGDSTTDRFTYTVSDADGDTAQGTITVSINGANDPPTAPNDSSQSTDEDSSVSIADGADVDLLELASDPDSGDSSTIDAVAGSSFSAGSAVTLDSGATATVESNGSWRYDPNGQFESLASGDSTTDDFTYTVKDDDGGTDQGIVTVTLTGVNDGPTTPADVDGDADEVGDDASDGTAVGLTIDSTDPDSGDTVTYSVTDDAGGRFEIDASTGVVTVADASGLDNESNANHTITVRATDGTASASANFTITVLDRTPPLAPASLDLDAASDTGRSDTDNVTNATTPTITGTAEADATVTISSDEDGQLGTTTADGTGNWSITVTADLSPAVHNITATATDAAGNTGSPSNALPVTIDTAAPGAPSIPDLAAASDSGDSNADDLTNDTTPNVSGSAEADATVTISSDVDGQLGTTSADGTGTWSFTSPTLSENTHAITVTATDAAGNTGTASSALQVTVDTTAPSAPSTLDLSAGSDTGTSSTDDLTNDTTPTVTGEAPANVEVTVNSDQDGQIGTTTADGDGDWSFTPETALSEATHNLTATATDAAGNTGSASTALSITVDASAPDPPSALDLATMSDSGVSNSDDVTNDTMPTLNGTAEANAIVTITSDRDGVLDTTTADGDGDWSFTPTTALSESTHSLTATATDTAGNEGGSSNALTVEVDASEPPTPETPDLTAESDSGVSNRDNVTNVTTPTLTGSTEADATVTITSDRDGVLGTTTANGDGDWSFTPSTLSEASHNLSVTATDAAGNTGTASSPLTMTIDTTAPGAPAAPDLTAASDSGASSTDDLTNDTTPTISGAGAEPNATITIESHADGTIGTTTVDDNGDWIVTTDALSEDTHKIAVTATDAAGNTGPTSGTLEVVIDTSAPGAPVALDLATATDSGRSATDHVTNDTTPTVSGTAEADSNVTLASNRTGTLGVTTPDGDGNWSLSSGVALPDGTHGITATATDAAGNTGQRSSTIVVTIDTGAPAAPAALDLPADSDSGRSSTDDLTNETTPTINGTAEANAVVTVVSDADGRLGTATATDAGSWSLTPDSALSGGIHNVTATATDRAGNAGQSSTSLSITIDTSPPGAPAAPDLTAATDTGHSNSDDITNESTPTVSGTAEPGSTVTLSSDQDGTLGTAAADGNGDWTVTPSSTLAEAQHALTVVATDDAGNTGTPSTALQVTVDTTAPSPDAGADQTVAEDVNASFTGSASTDAVGIAAYSWSFGDGTSAATGETTTHIYSQPSQYTVTLTVTDLAGNRANDTQVVTVTDTTDPTAQAGPDRTVDEDTVVRFNGSNSTDNVAVTGYEWAFDDGSANGTGMTVNHTYSHPGTYTVLLNATDAAGNTDLDTLTVTVLDVTPPAVTPSSATYPDDQPAVTTGQAVRLKVTVTDGASRVTNASVDVTAINTTGSLPLENVTGDHWATSITVDRAVHGSFQLPLSAEDAVGNRNTTENVTVVIDSNEPAVTANPTDYPGSQPAVAPNQSVIVNVSATDAIAGVDTVTVNASAVNTSGSITLRKQPATADWIGSVTVDTAVNGTVHLPIEVHDNATNANTSETVEFVVDATAPTITNASPTGIIADDTPSFTLNITDAIADVDATAFLVNLTDTNGTRLADVGTAHGNVSWNGRTLTVESPDPLVDGRANLTVIAADAAGNRANTTLNVTVDTTPPIPDAGPNRSVTLGSSVTVNASGSTDAIGISNYTWTFGDGANASGLVANHTYASPGTYTIGLVVIDTAGNNATDSALVRVRALPSTGSGGGTAPTPPALNIVVSGPTNDTAVNGSTSDGGQNVSVRVENPPNNETVLIQLSASASNGTAPTGENTSTPDNDSAQNATSNLEVTQLAIRVNGSSSFSLNVSTSEDPDKTGQSFDEQTRDRSVGVIEVEHSTPDEEIGDVTFTFRIRRSYLRDQGIPAAEITLYRNESGRWRALPTTVAGRDGAHVVFEADSPGLSVFAIGAEPASLRVVDRTLETDRVLVDEDIETSVTVENAGGTNASFEAVLAFDGRVVETVSAVVPARSTATIPVSHVVSTAGTVEVSLNGTPVGSVEAVAETATETATPIPTTRSTETRETAPPPSSSPTSTATDRPSEPGGTAHRTSTPPTGPANSGSDGMSPTVILLLVLSLGGLVWYTVVYRQLR